MAQRCKPSDNNNEENKRNINCLINKGFISEYPVSNPDRYTLDEVCWAQQQKRCENNKDGDNILHIIMQITKTLHPRNPNKNYIISNSH